MINSPWQSTVLRQHKLSNILSELVFAVGEGGLVPEDDLVTFVTPAAPKVPAFVSPITPIEYSTVRMKGVHTIMDARSFMRADRNAEAGHVVTNQLQANFFARIGRLTAMWVAEDVIRQDYLRVSDLPAQTYIAWVGQAISSKLGLDMDTARELQIITALFYIHGFIDADTAGDSKEKAKHIHLIQRWTRHPVQLIDSIVNECGYMMMMEDFVEQLKSHFSSNTRISQVNKGFLVMTLGRSWFGYGAQEISAVAIEYPPVYLALVEAACNTKVWRKTHLGKLTERFSTGKAGESFIRSMEMLAGKLN